MKVLLSFVVTSILLVIAGETPAHAQVIDSIEADIPFGFTVRNTAMPAGHYTIKRVASTEPGVMEILDVDYRPMFILVDSAQVLREPKSTELIFEKIGDQYFLSKIFEAGEDFGVEVPKTRAERRLEKEGAVTQLQSVTVLGRNAP